MSKRLFIYPRYHLEDHKQSAVYSEEYGRNRVRYPSPLGARYRASPTVVTGSDNDSENLAQVQATSVSPRIEGISGATLVPEEINPVVIHSDPFKDVNVTSYRGPSKLSPCTCNDTADPACTIHSARSEFKTATGGRNLLTLTERHLGSNASSLVYSDFDLRVPLTAKSRYQLRHSRIARGRRQASVSSCISEKLHRVSAKFTMRGLRKSENIAGTKNLVKNESVDDHQSSTNPSSKKFRFKKLFHSKEREEKKRQSASIYRPSEILDSLDEFELHARQRRSIKATVRYALHKRIKSKSGKTVTPDKYDGESKLECTRLKSRNSLLKERSAEKVSDPDATSPLPSDFFQIPFNYQEMVFDDEERKGNDHTGESINYNSQLYQSLERLYRHQSKG